MAQEKPDQSSAPEPAGPGGATMKPQPKRRQKPKRKPPQQLPPWKVLLHNDDVNSQHFVIRAIVELTPLKEQEASLRMKEAEDTGVALLLTTHKERAELYHDQFQSKGLTVTIEPAE